MQLIQCFVYLPNLTLEIDYVSFILGNSSSFLLAHRGRHRSQQASVESSDAPTYEENLVESLARSLERSGFTGVTVDQARRLRVVGFDGSTDPLVVLSWLDVYFKKVVRGI